MQLLKIYFSDVESYYKVKSLAKHILDNPDKLLFFIKKIALLEWMRVRILKIVLYIIGMTF